MLVHSYNHENYARLYLDDLIIDLTYRAHYLPALEYTKRLKIIDKMMHKFGFYRRTKWEKIKRGWQAKIRSRKVKEKK